jgi:hypothetical protein
MSYSFGDAVAQKMMKDNGIYDIDAEAAKMAEGQNREQMAALYTPPAAKTLEPTPEDPSSFTYDAPADSPNTQDQLRRYAGAGVPQNEAYRLLGGPRQKVGG